MKPLIYGILFLLLIVPLACNNINGGTDSEEENITLKNPLPEERTDELIALEMSKLGSLSDKNPDDLSFSVPFQFADKNGDDEYDHLLLLMDFAANEEKSINLKDLMEDPEEMTIYPKRTQAEIAHKINGEWDGNEYMGGEFQNTDHLMVPKEHTDHSWYIRYEGPGWESDLVGYRFYLDWRNATDIFGKKTDEMVLQSVGQDGFDSYHEPADWGMDILKVGESLGVGALGMWVNGKAERVAETSQLECEIVADGIIQSRVKTTYHDWNINDQITNIESYLSINAGSRKTLHEIDIEENLNNLCTGLVKHENGMLFSQSQSGKSGWGYIATYGDQSLAEDKLGMAVLFRNDDLIEITEDEHSHVVVLQPNHKSLQYYFLAAWEQETNGIKDQESFIEYLDKSIEKLNKPIEVNINAGD